MEEQWLIAQILWCLELGLELDRKVSLKICAPRSLQYLCIQIQVM
jgi:hypothetical protein